MNLKIKLCVFVILLSQALDVLSVSSQQNQLSEEPSTLFHQAELSLESGAPEDAIAKLKQVISTEPTYFSAYWLLLKAYFTDSDNEELNNVSSFVVSGEYYENALLYLEEDEVKSAIIELRNAIKYDTNNLPAYLKLAEIYLSINKPELAESILLEAQEQGVSTKLIAMPLAKSYLNQKRYTDILEKISIADLSFEEKRQMQLMWVSAYMGLRDYTNAEKLLNTLLLSEPDWLEAQIELAKLNLAQGNLQLVSELLKKVPEEAEHNADFWQLKGELEKRSGSWNKAISNYSHAIELDPFHLVSLQDRASLSLNQNLLEEAKLDIDVLRKQYPYDLRGMLLEAIYLRSMGDEDAAQVLIQNAMVLINKADYLKLREDPYSLALVASIYRFSHQYKKAEGLLQRYLELLPNNADAYRLLGDIQLKLNLPQKAADSLQQSLIIDNGDIRTIQLLAIAQAKLNAYDKAESLLQEMIKGLPDDASLQKQLAEVKLAQGQKADAIAIYKALLKKNNADLNTELLLANVYLRYGEFDEASSMAKALISKQANDPKYHHLLGTIQFGQKQYKEAQAAFKKAEELSPSFVPSILNLALIDIELGDLESAKNRYSRVIKIDPQHSLAMQQLSFLEGQGGDRQKAIYWLEKALEIDLSIDVGLRLVDQHVSAGNPNGAQSTIKRLLSKYPDNLRLLAVSAAWSLNNGNPAKAKRDFVSMTRIAAEQENVEWLLKIVDFQLSVQDIENAKKTVDKAVQIDAENAEVIAAQVSMFMSESNFDSAQKLAEKLILQHPGQVAGYLLLGNALVKLDQPLEAIDIYKKGLKKTSGSSQLAVSHYNLMRHYHDQITAVSELESWLTSNSQQDLIALKVLAAGHAEIGNTQKAIDLNEKLLKLNRNDPYLFNNLAYLYWRVGDERAKTYAEKAYEMAPESPAVLDTLGWILTQLGDHSSGLPMLRNALARSSSNAEIRYHYAFALYKSGREKSAKRELQEVVSSGQVFEGLEEAKDLLKKLKSS